MNALKGQKLTHFSVMVTWKGQIQTQHIPHLWNCMLTHRIQRKMQVKITTMWLSSTTEKNVIQLEDRLVLNCMATSPMTIFPNEKLRKWEGVYQCAYHVWSSDRQVSLRSLRGTNRNRISIVIELESFWSQELPNKETQCNCKLQIYWYLPDSWTQHSPRQNNAFNMLWHWQ